MDHRRPAAAKPGRRANAANGLVHDGFDLAFDGRYRRIGLKDLTGRDVLVYGRAALQTDLAEGGHR